MSDTPPPVNGETKPQIGWMRGRSYNVNTRSWIDSAQDMDYRKALVNAALNLRAQ